MSDYNHARMAYVLLVDGLPWAWTSNQELCTGWWTFDDRQILPGLLVPDMRFALDLERGVLEDDQVTFKILDVDGSILPSFFSGLAKDYKLLGQRLPPTVDPAPASSFDQYGDPLTLHDGTSGCYLGLEAIGADGARHWYSAWPGQLTAGFDHGGGPDDAMPVHTTWAEGPFLVEGRKACLFRVFYSEGQGQWGELGTHPLWWGTMLQAGAVDGRTWSLPFLGPASWLQKTLNAKAPSTWFRVKAELELAPSENTIYIGCFKLGYSGLSAVCGSITDTVADGSIDDVITSIQGHVATAIAATGPDGVWEDPDPIPGSEGNIIWNEHSISLWTNDDAGYAAYLLVRLHWKVWRFLGFDPEQHLYDIANIYFEPDQINPGYYYCVLSTTPAGRNPLIADGNVDWDGDGLTRVYKPDYPGGVVTLSGQGQQVLQIADVAGERIYCEGQTIRPAKTSVSINGSPCNATRWWVFRGMEQRAIGPGQLGEPEERYRVAKCSWVDSDGFMAQADGLFSDLYIESWHDPRLFGLNFPPMDPQLGWAGTGAGEEGGIYCAPLAVWGVWSERNPTTGRGTDFIDETLIRLLVSSGTAVVGPAADDPGDAQLEVDYPGLSYLTPGVNGDLDLEIADMGLGIPEAMINLILLGMRFTLPPGLQEVKVVALGPVQAEEVIMGLLAPADWSLSVIRGQFSVFQRSATLEFGGLSVHAAISVSDLGGEAGDPTSSIPGLDLRPVQPFDRLTVTHTANPVDDPTVGQEERQYRARDLGSRARTGARQRDVSAPYLPARRWWTEGPAPVASWETDFQLLWERQVAEWLAKPHRGIRGLRINRLQGDDLYPGMVLSLSLPWPVNTQGGYGMANVLGRITAVTHEASSCEAVCDILVQADSLVRQAWAPIARVVDDVEEPEERYDPETRTFYCHSWAEDGSSDYLNVDAFVEPPWSSVGGNAAFRVLQYDGVTWRATCSGVIDSVDPVAGTITHQGLTGTWYERMYAVIVVAPYDDVNQALWPKSVFAILGPAAGLPESRKLS